MYQIVIHPNMSGKGLTLAELEMKLLKYFRKKGATEQIEENGYTYHKLRNGLDIRYSRNGAGLIQMTVEGNFDVFQKSVDVLLGMYKGPIIVKYRM